MTLVLEDSCLAIDKSAESILSNRTLDSAGSGNVFIYSKKESVNSFIVIPSGKQQFNQRLSSFGHFPIISAQMPSSSDLEHDRNLTKISMEMSVTAFDELWSKEDDSYWDAY